MSFTAKSNSYQQMTVCTPLRLSVKTINAPDFAAEAESGALHLFAAKADGDLYVCLPMPVAGHG